MMKRKQIGVFSGSFNPIHVGHIILASYIKEFTDIDEVWLVVSPQNPLKDANTLLDDAARLEMANIAIEDFEGIKVSQVEFDMPKPSYTIDTLNKLAAENPEADFTLIIGADNWNDFHRWKDYKLLLATYKVMIYPRAGESIYIDKQYRHTVDVVDAPLVEVSSTFIRDGIKNSKDVRAFLPKGVYEYLTKNKYYQ